MMSLSETAPFQSVEAFITLLLHVTLIDALGCLSAWCAVSTAHLTSFTAIDNSSDQSFKEGWCIKSASRILTEVNRGRAKHFLWEIRGIADSALQ